MFEDTNFKSHVIMSVEYVSLFVGRAHFVIVIFLSIVNERKERDGPLFHALGLLEIRMKMINDLLHDLWSLV